MSTRQRLVFAALGLLLFGCLASFVALDEPRPRTGLTGAKAEQLTRYLEDEQRVAAFERTRALEFTFFGRHEYLWDRERDFVRVRFGDVEAQLPLQGGRAVLREGGAEVRDGAARAALREKAYAYFVNDSFWLFPFAQLRSPGVQRSVVSRDGRDALLVEYASGGLTPGDAYVYMPAHGDTPLRWAMFVSVLPLGGLETTWEGFVTLDTGARIATRHGTAGRSFVMFRDVHGARTLRELVGESDPFAALVRANAPTDVSPK